MNAKQYANQQHPGSPKERACDTDVMTMYINSPSHQDMLFFQKGQAFGFFLGGGTVVTLYWIPSLWSLTRSLLATVLCSLEKILVGNGVCWKEAQAWEWSHIPCDSKSCSLPGLRPESQSPQLYNGVNQPPTYRPVGEDTMRQEAPDTR